MSRRRRAFIKKTTKTNTMKESTKIMKMSIRIVWAKPYCGCLRRENAAKGVDERLHDFTAHIRVLEIHVEILKDLNVCEGTRELIHSLVADARLLEVDRDRMKLVEVFEAGGEVLRCRVADVSANEVDVERLQGLDLCKGLGERFNTVVRPCLSVHGERKRRVS